MCKATDRFISFLCDNMHDICSSLSRGRSILNSFNVLCRVWLYCNLTIQYCLSTGIGKVRILYGFTRFFIAKVFRIPHKPMYVCRRIFNLIQLHCLVTRKTASFIGNSEFSTKLWVFEVPAVVHGNSMGIRAEFATDSSKMRALDSLQSLGMNQDHKTCTHSH